jgi:hypothetical protein
LNGCKSDFSQLTKAMDNTMKQTEKKFIFFII